MVEYLGVCFEYYMMCVSVFVDEVFLRLLVFLEVSVRIIVVLVGY